MSFRARGGFLLILSLVTCLGGMGASLLPSTQQLQQACADSGGVAGLAAANGFLASGGDRRSYLLAAALFLDAGDPWASRDAVVMAAAASAATLHASDALYVLRASDALSRVGDFVSARALQRALLADIDMEDVASALAAATDSETTTTASTTTTTTTTPLWLQSLVNDVISMGHRDKLITINGNIGNNDVEVAEAEAAALSSLPSACAAAMATTVTTRTSVSHLPEMMRLVSAAISDGERGAFDSARELLRIAGGKIHASQGALCASSVVHTVERLLEGARVSAVGPAAALLEWRWEWSPSLLLTSSAVSSLTQNDLQAAVVCGAGAMRTAGGWADVAHVLLESDDGNASGSGSAGALRAALSWAQVVARAASALGDSHADVGLAHVVHGSLLVVAGDFVGAVIAQRSARAALVAAAGGNKTLAETSRGYARSLMSTAEAFLAVGEAERAVKYFTGAREAAERGGAVILAATAAGLIAVAVEDAAFTIISAGCDVYLVCAEMAARVAATEALAAYAAGVEAWAAVPAAVRAVNADAMAFAALAALAYSRARAAASPANNSQLEAVALYAVLGGGGYSSYALARGTSSSGGGGDATPQASLFLAVAVLGARALDSVGDASAAIAFLAAAERALGTADTSQTLLDKAGLALSARAVANRRLAAPCKGKNCASRRELAREAANFFAVLGARRAKGTGWTFDQSQGQGSSDYVAAAEK